MTNSNHEISNVQKIEDRNGSSAESKDIEAFGYSPGENRRIQMSVQKERKFGYSPKTAGYTPPKSSSTSSNVPLPKGGSGSSGQSSASSSQGNGGQGNTGTRK